VINEERLELDLCSCPFCGDTALEIKPVLLRVWHVHCSGCRCKGPEGKTPDDAILKWNSILNEGKEQRQMIVSMNKETNDPKLTQKLWKAMRMKRMFTVAEISRISKTSKEVTGNYIRLLAKNGYIREEGRKKGEGATKIWRCIKSDLVTGPTWAELLAYNGDERTMQERHQKLQVIRVKARKAG